MNESVKTLGGEVTSTRNVNGDRETSGWRGQFFGINDSAFIKLIYNLSAINTKLEITIIRPKNRLSGVSGLKNVLSM